MTPLSTLGRFFFAISMMAFGLQQLLTGRFVRLVPPLSAWIPGHAFWAYPAGAVLLAAGLAIASGRGARAAAALLGGMLVLSILFLHLPKALSDPGTGFMWTNPCKALAMLGGVIVLAGSERFKPLGRLFFASFLILGGIQHFVYADFVAGLVPGWIPGTRYWVYVTGLALIAGGIGILVPRTSRLAATMVGIMIFLWVVLLHVPRALAGFDAGEIAGVFEALALSGVAFLLRNTIPREVL